MSDRKQKIVIKTSINKKNKKNFQNPKGISSPHIKRGEMTPKTKKVISTFINSLFEKEKPKLNKSFSPPRNKPKNKIKEKAPKIIKNDNLQKPKEKEKSIPNIQKGVMSPKTKKVISTFINSLFENEKPKLNKSFSPSHKAKYKVKEDLPKIIKLNKKENKVIDIKPKTEKNERSKSSEKVQKHRLINYKKNNIRININSNNNKKRNRTQDITNTNSNTENKENKKSNRKNIKTEYIAKTPINRTTIGEKMMKEEIAKEKKICAEKLKIIKEHILSLQRKEEELSKKMMQLNNRENALNKKNIEIEPEKEKEDNIDNIQNELVKNNEENKSNLEEENKKIVDNIENENSSEIKENESKDITVKISEKIENESNEQDTEKEKSKQIETEKEIINDKNKVKEKTELKPNKNRIINKNIYKKEKTPQKKLKKIILEKKIDSNNSKKKITFPKNKMKNNNSTELTRKIKPKNNKK